MITSELLATLIPAVQRKVGVDDDGKPGLQTWTAIAKALGVSIDTGTAAVPSDGSVGSDGLDPRTVRNLATLHARVQPIAAEFIREANRFLATLAPSLTTTAIPQAAASARIIDGSRTFAEQDALYAQGRSRPGDRVTNAPGGFSNHNFGLAFDVGIFAGERYLDDSPLYRQIVPIAKARGLFWGGDWRNPVDEPHYEMRPAWAHDLSEQAMIAELRRRHAAGIDAFA